MFRGSLVALVTPMHTNGEIDLISLAKLVEWHIQAGTQGIVVNGTTGEAATLTSDEKRQVIQTTLKQAAGRVPVIAGTGSNSTQASIEWTKQAMQEGVDACLLVTPYYNKPTQEGLYYHYRAIAEAVPIPQILYNVPGRTACDMQPATVARLATIPNIVGIKEATGDMARVEKIKALCGDSLDIYSGDDATALSALLLGAKGVISVTANVAPSLMSQMTAAALAGDQDKANSLNKRLEALHKNLFVEANPIPCKWCLHAMGLIEEGIRLPLTPLAQPYHAVLRAALQIGEINHA